MRYYLSAERSEIYSTESGLLSLIKKYPNLSVRPYGGSSESGGQTANQSDVSIHDLADLSAIRANLLKNIGFDKDHLLKYGRANDVPILIYEAAVDCQHPSFFGATQDDHAFTGATCAAPEPATTPVYLDWTMTPNHHGTCVASLIGGRATSPYGPSLAPGADLNTIDSGSLNGETLKQFYRRERQPFVVNYSSGDPPVTESQWRGLLQQPLVRNEVLLVAAADNDLLSNQKKFPAYLAREYANVVSVGALDKSGKDIWEDSNTHQGSNTGNRVELLAPGEDVPCAAEVAQGQAVYSTPAGTSFAAPIVSSVAALMLEKRLSPREVKARLLATADPMGQKQRNGEPYALFGKLNVENALSNPKVSHIKFLQDGKEMQLDADLSDASSIKMQSPSANLPVWIPIPIDYLLSIRKETDPASSNMFRVVMFDDAGESGGTIQLRDRVTLDGCLRAQSRDTGEVFVLAFGAGCIEATQITDRSKIIDDLQLLIAPTLGPVRMQ